MSNGPYSQQNKKNNKQKKKNNKNKKKFGNKKQQQTQAQAASSDADLGAQNFDVTLDGASGEANSTQNQGGAAQKKKKNKKQGKKKNLQVKVAPEERMSAGYQPPIRKKPLQPQATPQNDAGFNLQAPDIPSSSPGTNKPAGKVNFNFKRPEGRDVAVNAPKPKNTGTKPSSEGKYPPKIVKPNLPTAPPQVPKLDKNAKEIGKAFEMADKKMNGNTIYNINVTNVTITPPAIYVKETAPGVGRPTGMPTFPRQAMGSPKFPPRIVRDPKKPRPRIPSQPKELTKPIRPGQQIPTPRPASALSLPGTQRVLGCTNPAADNYNPAATHDDGSCYFGEADMVPASNEDVTPQDNPFDDQEPASLPPPPTVGPPEEQVPTQWDPSPSSLTQQNYKYINNNLFSGSVDPLRNLISSYYRQDVNEEEVVVSYAEPSMNISEFNQISTDDESSQMFYNKIESVWVTPIAEQEKTSPELLFPSNRAAVYFVGSGERIANDTEWQQIIQGGTYFTEPPYPGLHSNEVFEDQNYTCMLPMDKLRAKEIYSENYDDQNYCTVQAHYNYYVETFENAEYPANQLPNFYLTYLTSHISMGQWIQTNFLLSSYGEDIQKFTSLENTYITQYDTDAINSGKPPLREIASSELFPWPASQYTELSMDPSESGYEDWEFKLREYYATYARTSFTGEVLSNAATKTANLILHKDVIDTWGWGLVSTRWPYYVSIEYPYNESYNDLNTSLEDSGYTYILLSAIKKYFGEENEFTTKLKPMTIVDQALSVDDAGIPIETPRTTPTQIKYVDLSSILLDDIYDVGTEFADLLMISDNEIENNIVTNIDGIYRFQRSLRTLDFLNRLKTYTEQLGEFVFPRAENGYDVSNWNALEFFNLAEDNKITAVVGYRIEKIGSDIAANGTLEEVVLQNYYVPNIEDAEVFTIVDSQVKYGVSYTYKIYEYKLVIGYRYQYSDFKPTRLLGTDFGTESDPLNGLEFYDFTTEVMTVPEALYLDADILETEYDESEVTTGAQILTSKRYLCECLFNIETTVEIHELPVSTKKISVLDNPPREIDTSVYQMKDNSQIVGLHGKTDSFVPKVFPLTLNEAEAAYKRAYLESQNLLESDKILLSSATSLRYVEIYRIDTYPNSIEDFNNNLIATKDLKLKTANFTGSNEDEDFFSTCQTSTACFYEEIIPTNKTFYYVCRFVNEHGTVGHFSPVQVVKLMDDGGYKYLQMDMIQKSELNTTDIELNPSISFKKLMQLIPNVKQTYLDTSNVDYSKDAYENISNITVGSADSLIWGKTFKIRLTSKKTGKKIDLNVTYNLRESV